MGTDKKREYNYNKLKGLIKEHCGTQDVFAKRLGIGATTLHSRLIGATYFNQWEITIAKEIFGLEFKDINEIFFTEQ